MLIGEFQENHRVFKFALNGTGVFLKAAIKPCLSARWQRDVQTELATSACLSSALLNVLFQLTRQSAGQMDDNI